MKTQFSIILSALIVGGSIVAASVLDRYQLAIGADQGDAYAWRINKHTGEVVACQIVYDPFKPGGDIFNAPAKPQAKPMVVIECGDN